MVSRIETDPLHQNKWRFFHNTIPGEGAILNNYSQESEKARLVIECRLGDEETWVYWLRADQVLRQEEEAQLLPKDAVAVAKLKLGDKPYVTNIQLKKVKTPLPIRVYHNSSF